MAYVIDEFYEKGILPALLCDWDGTLSSGHDETRGHFNVRVALAVNVSWTTGQVSTFHSFAETLAVPKLQIPSLASHRVVVHIVISASSMIAFLVLVVQSHIILLSQLVSESVPLNESLEEPGADQSSAEKMLIQNRSRKCPSSGLA